MRRIGWLPVLTALIVALLAAGTVAQAQDAKGDKGKHPRIQAAIKNLEQADKQLDKADDVGYGGHRHKARQLIKQAQDELKEALAAAESKGGKPSAATGAPAGASGTSSKPPAAKQ